jgi:antitoxin PrlF
MVAPLETESTLTDRYQTTVPEIVRRALKLGKRDRIHYSIRPNGEVVITRAAQPETNEDPVLGRFLAFLAQDIANHPEQVRAIDNGLVGRIQSLVGDIEVDLDAPLPAEQE